MKPKNISGVPQHHKGSFHDTECRKEIINTSDVDAQFNILKQRLFSINNWRKYCRESSTDFKLCDESGNIVDRLPKIGDFIRIDIPGPGGSEGRSFDWVQIIMIDTDSLNRAIIQCRPSRDPVKKKTAKIAHFYSNAATSTFIVSKGENFIQSGIYGRNEVPNLKSGFLNSFRNLMVAFGGMMGFSKIQWKCLVGGLVDFN